jgi:preprotein translocase subunit YajC
MTALLLAATAKKSSAGSSTFLILLVVLLGVYLLWLRPQRKRQQAAARVQRQADVGDEVVTAAGIYGRVIAFDGDRASVEIAPGTTIEVAKRALGQRVDPIEIGPDDDDDDSGEVAGDLDPGTGFGHPGYDGHDDLNGSAPPPAPTDALPVASTDEDEDLDEDAPDGEHAGDEQSPGGQSPGGRS